MTRPAPSRVLPPRRSSDRAYRIAVVCLGNICRSPIAEVVLRARLEEAGLAEKVEVVSGGTGDWHVGGPMDPRAAGVLTAHGYDATRHRARQFAPVWFDECDAVLAMDRQNHDALTALLPGQADADRVRMFRDLDPDASADDRDVPDPYYGGDEGFDDVLAMVERTAAAVVDAVTAEVERD